MECDGRETAISIRSTTPIIRQAASAGAREGRPSTARRRLVYGIHDIAQVRAENAGQGSSADPPYVIAKQRRRSQLITPYEAPD